MLPSRRTSTFNIRVNSNPAAETFSTFGIADLYHVITALHSTEENSESSPKHLVSSTEKSPLYGQERMVK